MNAIWMKDLAEKTRRGQRGIIEAGRQIGTPAYGYRLANRIEGSKTFAECAKSIPKPVLSSRRYSNSIRPACRAARSPTTSMKKASRLHAAPGQWTYKRPDRLQRAQHHSLELDLQGMLVYGATERV